jgi:arsenate reductase (glutaredoxin)
MIRKLYAYPKCSTCVKAQRFLKEQQLAYEMIDITITPPSQLELEGMLLQYDGVIKKIFNTSGVQYRELGLSKKFDSMSEKQLIDLLANNGKLVKRPFLVIDGKPICVGFKQDQWQKAVI